MFFKTLLCWKKKQFAFNSFLKLAFVVYFFNRFVYIFAYLIRCIFSIIFVNDMHPLRDPLRHFLSKMDAILFCWCLLVLQSEFSLGSLCTYDLKDADCTCNDFGTTIKIDRETNLIRIHGGCDCNITLPTTFRGSIFSYYYIPALLAVIIVSVHIFCPLLLSLNYLNSMKLFTDHTIVQLHLFYILIRMTFGFSDSRTWT